MIIAFISSKNGSDFVTAQWQGKIFEAHSRHGVEFALCRKLVEAGIPDMPMAVLPSGGGAEQSRLRSVHFAAAKTIVEGEHGETLADFRKGPTARRTCDDLDGTAVSFAVTADCVLAADAATSPLMLARYRGGTNKGKAARPIAMGSIGDRVRRSAFTQNMRRAVCGVR